MFWVHELLSHQSHQTIQRVPNEFRGRDGADAQGMWIRAEEVMSEQRVRKKAPLNSLHDTGQQNVIKSSPQFKQQALVMANILLIFNTARY